MVGDVLISIHRDNEAKAILELGIAVDPEAASGYELLALASLNTGEDTQALACITQALQRDPKNRFALALHNKLAQRRKEA